MKNNNKNGDIEVLNNNVKRMQEMLEEVRDIESRKSALDVKVAQNLCSLVTDQYLRDEDDYDEELIKSAEKLMATYNTYFFELTRHISKKEAKKAGFQPITGPDGSGISTGANKP